MTVIGSFVPTLLFGSVLRTFILSHSFINLGKGRKDEK